MRLVAPPNAEPPSLYCSCPSVPAAAPAEDVPQMMAPFASVSSSVEQLGRANLISFAIMPPAKEDVAVPLTKRRLEISATPNGAPDVAAPIPTPPFCETKMNGEVVPLSPITNTLSEQKSVFRKFTEIRSLW